jgi:hypothetical protein
MGRRCEWVDKLRNVGATERRKRLRNLDAIRGEGYWRLATRGDQYDVSWTGNQPLSTNKTRTIFLICPHRAAAPNPTYLSRSRHHLLAAYLWFLVRRPPLPLHATRRKVVTYKTRTRRKRDQDGEPNHVLTPYIGGRQGRGAPPGNESQDGKTI